jgi:hypothetical protein
MRGAIVLVAETQVWRATARASIGDGAPSVSLLCDLAAEFCNLLCGRLRNRFLRLGVDVRCGIPTSAYGAVELPCLPDSSALHVVQQSFLIPGGTITMRADFLFRDGFAFPTDKRNSIEPHTAAVLLF